MQALGIEPMTQVLQVSCSIVWTWGALNIACFHNLSIYFFTADYISFSLNYFSSQTTNSKLRLKDLKPMNYLLSQQFGSVRFQTTKAGHHKVIGVNRCFNSPRFPHAEIINTQLQPEGQHSPSIDSLRWEWGMKLYSHAHPLPKRSKRGLRYKYMEAHAMQCYKV